MSTLFDSQRYQTGMYPDGANKRSFQEGLEFQDYIVDIMQRRFSVTISIFGSKVYQQVKGESAQGIEVKLDKLWTSTNRVSIEIAEKSREERPTYVWSGVYRNDNTWLYIQGNQSGFFIFQRHTLQWVYEQRTTAGRANIIPSHLKQLKGDEFTRRTVKGDKRPTDYDISVKSTVISYYIPLDWAKVYGFYVEGDR